MVKGVMGKQNGYTELTGVHLIKVCRVILGEIEIITHCIVGILNCHGL